MKKNYTKEEKKQYFNDIKKQLKKLQEEVNSIKTDEEYQNYLKIISQFNRYSLFNCIKLFREGCRCCKSYKQWQSSGRYVKKGELAHKIFAPTYKKYTKQVKELNDNGEFVDIEEEKQYKYFVLVPVFDITQTEGEAIEGLDFGKRIDKKTNNAKDLFELFKTKIEKNGLVVIEKNLGEYGKNGYTNFKEIVINSDRNDNEKLSTLIHELAHNVLGHKSCQDKNRSRLELEAESLTYIVMSKLDQPNKSIQYLKSWNKDTKEEFTNLLSDVVKGRNSMMDILELEVSNNNN